MKIILFFDKMTLTPAVSLLSFISSLLLPTPIVFDTDPTLITTAYGPVRGQQIYGVKGNAYYSFQGIPYAKPPIGRLRFKDPQLPEKWSKPFEATAEGPAAHGFEFYNGFTNDPTASEDCLRLNVFAKKPNTSYKVPVMVFIHGGGFVGGSSAQNVTGEDFFMQKNVVLVTFNHRLGALGFLSVDDADYQIPGNAGLKDQSFALLWVHQNIARFGGDPDNVTLFGNSAGAACVHYHMMSPYSKGLFHKAIIQSGSAFGPWASNADKTLNERLALKLGWNGEGGTQGIMKTLMSAKAVDIVSAQNLVSVTEWQRLEWFLFVPRVEPYDNGSCFISASIEDMSKSAWGNDLPLMIGGNSKEGYVTFFNFIDNGRVLENPLEFFQNALPKKLTLTPTQRHTLGTELRQFYLGNSTLTNANIEQGLVPLLTDALFWQGLESIVQSRLKRSNSKPTYLYRFSFNSEWYVYVKFATVGEIIQGASHCDELLFMFYFTGQNGFMPINSDEDNVLNTFINTWTQFAATGNPNGCGTHGVSWKQVKKSKAPLKCFNIDRLNSFIDLPETKRIQFWNSLYSFV